MSNKGMIVSYRMEEPEWPLACECRYDKVLDRMDREDCSLHCDMEEDLSARLELPIVIKKTVTSANPNQENVA
jgi:hypothetical protein